MSEEHSFANYIRILGKGKNGARPLTRQEAYEAMKQIYCFDVEPEQLGAFMALMRVKEETPEEVAGFVRAIRESIVVGRAPEIAIDWSSYAGKRRQLPWYLLAALTLSKNGYPVLMHGMHRDDERVYTRQALQALGIEEATNLEGARQQITEAGFSFLDIENYSPYSAQLIEMRQQLGLRPPLHTVARMLNPFAAPVMLQSVFHPNYAETHQKAARLLGQPNVLAFKGEGGEIERIPERAVKLYGCTDEVLWEEDWPALLSPGKYVPETFPDWNHYRDFWQGISDDFYGQHAVIGTLALALRAMNEVDNEQDAHQMAEQLWIERHDESTLTEDESTLVESV